MANNSDLIEKILTLQSKVDSTIIPQYEQAVKAVADLQAQLEALINLGKLTKAQGKTLTDIQTNLLPSAQQAAKDLTAPHQQQQKIQQSFGGLMDQLAAGTPNMKAQTQAQYDSLKTAAFAAPPDPAAQDAFKKYVGNLQTVHTENMQKSLRAWVQNQVKQGMKVTIDDFAAQQQRLATGETVAPDENPQLQRQFAAANARGLARAFNRNNFSAENFRNHMSQGGYAAIGYASFDLAQNVGQYASQPLTGDRITQEARYRSALGLVPGVTGILGAIGGSFTPVGPYGGAAIGAGLGGMITAPLSALSERHETLRLTGEDFSQVLGRGTAAADKFASVIEATAGKFGTPAAELAGSLRTLSSSVAGFNPAKAVTLQATLQRGAGDLYPELISAQARAALTIPLSTSYQNMVAGNRAPDAGLYRDAANYYALHGDLAASNQQLIASGQFAYTPAMQAAQTAKGRFDAEGQEGGSLAQMLTGLARAIPFSADSRRGQAIDATLKRLQDAGGDKVASGSAKDARDAIYTANRNAQEMAEAIGYDVARAGTRAGMAQFTGRGAAGMRPYVAQEVSSLTDQQAQLRIQEAQVQAAIKTASPDDVNEFKADLGRVRLQIVQTQAAIKQAQVGLFRQTQSEEAARFEGNYTRTGIFGDALTLGGASSFDARVGRNVRDRQAQLGKQARYDDALAADTTNFLSPEERQERRTRAAQERLEQRVLANRLATERIGDTTAASGLRQADVRTQVTRAQVTGDVTQTLEAQNRLVGEQLRLQTELKQRLDEGNLTYQQRTQLQTQLKDLESQTIAAQRQAVDTALQGFQSRAEAQATTSYARQERGVRLRGTSDETAAAGTAGYDASLQSVALAHFRMLDPTLSPDQKLVAQAQYEQAKNAAEQRGIDAASTVAMGPEFETRELRLRGRLSRQMRSPFEPGSVLQSNADLAKLGGQKLTAIDAQMARVRAREDLTADEKRAALRNLTGQQEDTRNEIFESQQSVDVGWMDRLVSMSVNAPSFAARLMPGSDRVAEIAERRGLGRMSARVFGYTDPQSYRDTMSLGVLPSETSRMAFGMRPGDYPGLDSPDAPVTGGRGLTLDSIDSGGAGTGLPPQMVGELSQTLGALTALLAKGLQVTVHQINPETGQVASHTQNAGALYDAKGMMKGGASQHSQGKAW